MKVKVLLLQNVAKLGNKGDIVEVSDAYARNVLLRQGKGKIADKATIKAYEAKKKKEAQEKQEYKKKLKEFIEETKSDGLKIAVSAAGDGHLYEKIDIRHIHQAILEQYKLNIPEKDIDFPMKKVSKIGDYEFFVKVDGKKVSIPIKVLTK